MDIFSILAIIVMLVAVVTGFIKRFSYTNVLVVANLFVFMLTLLAPAMPGGLTAVQTDLGFRAVYLTNNQGQLYTLFTNLFVHASFIHVIGNMLFLFLIGNSYEERVGKKKFVATYFIAGLAGTLVESLLMSGSPSGMSTLMIGASGAIAGVMGAMLLLYPHDKVPMFLLIIFLPASRSGWRWAPGSPGRCSWCSPHRTRWSEVVSGSVPTSVASWQECWWPISIPNPWRSRPMRWT